MVTSLYKFEDMPACNMCGHPSAKNKVIGVRLNTSQGFKPRSVCGVAVTVVRCKKCMLIYPNPLPVPVEIQAHYGIPPEEYWTTKHSELCESYFTNEIDKVPPGHPGVNSMIYSLLNEVGKGKIKISDIVKLCSVNPAKRFNLFPFNKGCKSSASVSFVLERKYCCWNQSAF